MIIESAFEVYVTNVFPSNEYVIYGDKTSYDKYIVCVGKFSDPEFKCVLLHFDDVEDIVTFLQSINIPHQIYLDPYHKGILSFMEETFDA